MKQSQKLKINFENIQTIQRFGDIDKQLYGLATKLETEGNLFGPVVSVICNLCVTMEYADKKIGPTKPTIFGHDADEFIDRQYK